MGASDDLFSARAAKYALARPTYPRALYDTLAQLAPHRRAAWDCATGNGQAAVDLGAYFDRVIATDASAEQIRHARAVPNVEYRVARAEASGLPDAHVALTTVAQALHWLEHERFYAEVRRVTVPGGVFAAWSYGACSAGQDVEDLLREFEHGLLGPYWDSGRRWVIDGYRTIPFPFEEIPAPLFELRVEWSLSQLGEYLSTWSAVGTYQQARGEDPVAPLLDRMRKHWGSPERTRIVVWPLAVRIGRIG